MDLNLLNSYFIDKKNNHNVSELINLIEKNIRDKGWLIISTHDVQRDPSDFGCSIGYFEDVVEYIACKDIQVLKIDEVIDRCCLT